MKKVFALALAAIMSIALLAGCDTPASDSSSDTVTDYTVKISENVPEIFLTGTYRKTPQKDGDGFTTVAYYENTDDSALLRAFGVYSFEKGDLTLEEAGIAAAESDFPDQAADIVHHMDSEWEEEGDYTYTYYTASDRDFFAEPTFCQSFIFEDGGRFVELFFWYRTEAIDIDDGVKIYVPLGAEKQELTEYDISLGVMSCYCYEPSDAYRDFDPDEEFCDFDINVYEAEDMNAAIYRSQDKQEVEYSDVTEYTLEKNGKTYDCAYYRFNAIYDGEAYIGEMYICHFGDRFLEVDFYQPEATYSDYTAVSIPGMLYGIEITK